MEEESIYKIYQTDVLTIINGSPAKSFFSSPGSSKVVHSSKKASPDETKSFYKKLFTYLGIPETQGNLLFIRAWAQIEGARATYNPLNTTYRGGSSSSFNSKGVKNYPTIDAGIIATAETIRGSLYAGILNELKRGMPDRETARSFAKKWEKKGGPLWVWVRGPYSTAGDLPTYIAAILGGNVSSGDIYTPK